jgi:hypothetical protein
MNMSMKKRPPLDPDDQGLLNLRKSLVKACGDSAFRKNLRDKPQETAAAQGWPLRDEDVDSFRAVENDLVRITTNTQLDPVDAENWATGLLLTSQVCPLALAKWDVGVLSIQRFAFVCADLSARKSASAPKRGRK